MAAFTFDAFKGIRPRLNARLLPITPIPEAETAENLRMGSGALEPWNDEIFEELTCTGANDIETIYRFRNAPLTRLWLQFADDVDVAKGPLLDDALERTYYTGTAQTEPRFTFIGIVDGAAPCLPDDHRILGIPAPTVAPTLVGEAVPSTEVTGIVEGIIDAPAAVAPPTEPGGATQGILNTRLDCDFHLEQPDRLPYSMNSWYFGEDTGYFAGDKTFNFDLTIGVELKVTAVPSSTSIVVDEANGAGFISATTQQVAIQGVGALNKIRDNDTGTAHDGHIRFYIPNGTTISQALDHNLQIDDVIRVTSVPITWKFTIGNGKWKDGTIPLGGEFYGAEDDSVGADPDINTWPTAHSNVGVDSFYLTGLGHSFVDAWWTLAGPGGTDVWPFEGRFDWILTERDGVDYTNVAADVESRVYVYTWVSDLGEESAPSPASAIVTIPTDGDVTLSAFGVPPAVQQNITNVRIYRANTGTQVTEFQFVTEEAVPFTSFIDQVADIDLGEVLQTESWEIPPAAMEGITTLPNGVMAGFTDKTLYFSEPYFPHAWPPEYQLAVDHDIIGLGVLPQGVLVLTTGTPYMVVGVHPRAFALRHFEFAQSCTSKKSIINTRDSIIYSSPDGLVRIGSGGFKVITEEYFTKREWNILLDPTEIDGNWHDNRYFGFHSGGGFVYDPFDESIGFTTLDAISAASFVDAEDDRLYTIPLPAPTAQIECWDGDVTQKTFIWRSPQLRTSYPFNPSAARVLSDSYPLTFRLFDADGNLEMTKTVVDKEIFRLPGGYIADFVQIEVEHDDKISYVGIAESVEELSKG
jgi:hypothetical protein